MARGEEILYAVVGAGDFAIEKVKGARNVVDRTKGEQYYSDFVTRGRSLSTRIRNAAPTKRALAQTKTARSQVKAAATSISKAVDANTKAARSAAGKVVKSA